MSLRVAVLSVEAAEPDGETKVELEYVLFAKLGNPDALLTADSSEGQEQYELRGINGGIRVRAVNNEKYILTTKTWVPGINGKNETEEETIESIFNAFKAMAPSGQIKKRFNFKIPDTDLVWEVDVFYDNSGKPYEWVKLDLEVPAALDKLPPYPEALGLTEAITAQYNERTPEQQKFIDELFSEYFIVKNPAA